MEVYSNLSVFNANQSLNTNNTIECYGNEYLQTITGSVPIILHVLGLILMAGNQSKQLFIINQSFLIRYLSITEIYLSILLLLRFKRTIEILEVIKWSFFAFGYIQYFSIMMMILLDRFSIAYFNIKYNTYVQPRYYNIACLVVFIIFIFPSGISIYLYNQSSLNTYNAFTDVFIDIYVTLMVIYFILSIAVYSYILISRILRQKKLNNNTNNTITGNAVRVPLFITTTFLVLVVAPFITSWLYPTHKCVSYSHYKLFCLKLNFVLDALIYILLIPRCRKKLINIRQKIIRFNRKTNGNIPLHVVRR